MAVDISGGEDSLFWKAGIDTSDFDTGMQKLTEQIQQQTKSQIQVQQQAAQSQKLVAQQILQSAGAVKGVDMGIAAQLRGLTSLQGGIEKIGAEMAQTTEDLQRQIQGLKGQTIELKAKGLDTTALSASLDKVEAEVEKINATPLDIATGKVDAEPLLAALRQVQAEYDKLQMEPLKLNVDTSGLQPVSPIFSQASVDAFKQVQPSIVEAIRAYKEFQKTGEGALSAVADGVARLSAEQLQIKVGGVNTASVEKAFEGLQRRFDGLNNTALVLKVKGVDTASLTTAIDKAKADFEALRGLTLSPDMDLTEFQQQYKQLQQSLTALESEKIQLRAEGVDTSKLERDIKNIRIQMAGLSREALRVQVDGSSLEVLESQLATLKKQSLDLDFKGMDTEPVLDALEKIEEQIEKIKRKPVEVRSGTVNLGPLSGALLKVGDEIDAIAAQPVVVRADASGLRDIALQADGAAHALHEMGEASTAALRGGQITQQGLANALKDVRAAGKNAKEEYQQLNTAFHSIFHGKSGSESLGAQWSNGIKQGTVSIGEFIGSLKLTDAQLATLPEKLEKAGYVAKGTFTGMAAGVEALDKAVAKVQGRLMTLEGATRAAGGGVQAFDPKALGITSFLDELKGSPVEIPVTIKIGSLTEKTQELERLKQQFAELSEVDRNSDIGRGLVQNIQQVEGELEDINRSFLKVEQHAAGSLNEKVATLNKLKDQYAALSEVDRRSSAGRQLAQNIHGLDRDVAQINKEFERTNSLAQQAATALGAYFSIQAATGFIQDMVRVRGEFQQLEVAFTTMLKSKEKADQLMAQVTELAATTPFELKEVAGGAKQLLAYGFEADKVTEVLRRMGDIASGTGTDIEGLIRALGQVKTKGKLQSEEMFQFAERGVPIVRELSKQMGVAESEVQKLVESGKVGFKDVYQALSGLTNEGGLFFNMMEAQSKTLTGQISNLKDSWNGMLNELGRSNEGIISGSIGTAKKLVDNYETVLDVIKVLIATYGTYRAALMLTTVASTSLGVATKGLTALQILQAGATAITQKATALLNRTLLANPYVLVAAGVAALVAALVVFGRRSEEASRQAKALADISKRIGDGMAEAQGKIQPYVEALKNANLSEQQRVDIYNKLKAIDPDIVKGIDAKTISYEKLKKNVDGYLESLRRKITLEANEEATTASIKEENDLNDKLAKLRASYKRLVDQETANKKSDNVSAQVIIEIARSKQVIGRQIDETKKLIEEQQTLQRNLAQAALAPTTTAAGEKTLKDYLEETEKLLTQYDTYVKLIASKGDAEAVQKALTAKMESLAPGDRAIAAYKQRILEVNEIIKRYAIESPKTAAKAQETVENKINALLEQRRSILEAIADAQAKANQSGMTKQASEVDKINERYDDLLDKVDKYQRAVEVWNKRNPRSPVQGIGQGDREAIEAARRQEVSNQLMREDVERYEKALKEKSALYQQYEQTVQEVGRTDADKLYADEKRAFTSYLDYLKSEIGKLGTKISLGVELNLADQGKLKALTEELKRVSKEQADQQIEDTRRVMVETANVAQQRLAVEAKYQKDLAILKEQYLNKGQFTEFTERKKVLDQALQEDLKALAQHLGKQSSLYRQFNQKVYDDVRSRIDAEIKALADQLAVIEKQDPGMAKAIRAAIKEWRQLRNEMDGAAAKSEEFTRGLQAAQNAFSSLSALAAGFDDELAEAFGSIGQLIGAFEDLQKAIDAIDSAEKAGESAIDGIMKSADLVTAVVKAIIAAINVIAKDLKKVKESKIKSREEVDAFYAGILQGEQQVNELMRQRQREQVGLNKLTYERIAAERALLEEQKKAIQAQAGTIMQQLQGESFIAGESVKKKSFWDDGIGRRRYVEKEYQTLLGKSFEEIEGLYLKGQLDGKAKELFEQLQKLKQEGADIDRMLEESKREAAQVFTGTTQESITDAILEGLKQGKRGIRDFAQTFEELMQGAMLNALKYQALEAPIKAFYEQFATLSQSGGALTSAEIEQLRKMYASILENAQVQFDQIQQVAGVKFNTSTSGGSNSLQGAIRGITEQQAELLAGQFGGLRLTALEHLRVAQTSLNELNRIQQNTASTVKSLAEIFRVLNGAATGNNPLHVKPR